MRTWVLRQRPNALVHPFIVRERQAFELTLSARSYV